MAELRFPAPLVRRLVQHTMVAPDQWRTADMPVVQPSLQLVRDRSGVYLISNGIPGLLEDGSIQQSPEQQNLMRVFAEGMDPRFTGPDWLLDAAAALGEEDFGEVVPASYFLRQLQAQVDFIELRVTPNSIEFNYLARYAQMRAHRPPQLPYRPLTMGTPPPPPKITLKPQRAPGNPNLRPDGPLGDWPL